MPFPYTLDPPSWRLGSPRPTCLQLYVIGAAFFCNKYRFTELLRSIPRTIAAYIQYKRASDLATRRSAGCFPTWPPWETRPRGSRVVAFYFLNSKVIHEAFTAFTIHRTDIYTAYIAVLDTSWSSFRHVPMNGHSMNHRGCTRSRRGPITPFNHC